MERMENKSSLKQIVALIGLLASCIGIFAFVTGWQSIADIIRAASASPTSVTTRIVTPVPITPAPPLIPDKITTANASRLGLLYSLDSHTGSVNSIVFSPDGRLLASGSSDNTVKLWDVKTWEELYTLTWHAGPVTSLAFSPDGTMLVSVSQDRTVKLWDTKTGQGIRKIGELADSVWTVAFSPDAKLIAFASSISPLNVSECGTIGNCPDGEIRLFDVRAGQEIYRLVGHRGWVTALAFSPDSKLLASGGWADWSVKIWDVKAGKETVTLTSKGQSGSSVSSIAFSPDGNILAAIVGMHDVKLWNTGDGSEIPNKINHPDSQNRDLLASGSLSDLTFSPDGTLLALGSGQFTGGVSLSLWEVTTGRMLREIFGDGKYTRDNSVCFSPDGRLLASGSNDGKVRIWGIR
jgi:WD40 repeat protein